MQSNITEAFGAELHLAEPHFDDEATLLSARPVVPLQRLKAQARSTRLLAFGLAIVVALMVGALGATFIYKQRGQKQEPALTETATAVSEPTSTETLSVAEAGGATLVSGEAKPLVGEGLANRKANVDAAKRATGQNETLNKKALKEAWQAERVDVGLRRGARHQSRIEARKEARRSQSPNGLLRVREIFEGPPRP